MGSTGINVTAAVLVPCHFVPNVCVCAPPVSPLSPRPLPCQSTLPCPHVTFHVSSSCACMSPLSCPLSHVSSMSPWGFLVSPKPPRPCKAGGVGGCCVPMGKFNVPKATVMAQEGPGVPKASTATQRDLLPRVPSTSHVSPWSVLVPVCPCVPMPPPKAEAGGACGPPPHQGGDTHVPSMSPSKGEGFGVPHTTGEPRPCPPMSPPKGRRCVGVGVPHPYQGGDTPTSPPAPQITLFFFFCYQNSLLLGGCRLPREVSRGGRRFLLVRPDTFLDSRGDPGIAWGSSGG